MHNWNNDDERIDWKSINEAAEYIGLNLRKWGRCSVMDWKEKYGTVRVYCSFGWWGLHSITHPGWAYIQYKSKLMRSLNYSMTIRGLCHLLNRVVVPYQIWLYKFLYARALVKWPHLRSEILQGADYSELLEEHGIHRVRTSENSYQIYYDWHPDNFYVRCPRVEEPDGEEEVEEGPVRWIKREGEWPHV